MYVVRGLGGVLFLSGALVMVWNMWMTIRGAKPADIALPHATPAE
ncbi:MAG: cytochrome c oxidase cbb3-type subunit 1 [Reinekea sp.]|jgi:cytochrome c oxidase cbb3-type subunit 1